MLDENILEQDEQEEEVDEIDWDNFELRKCERCTLCKTRRNVVLPKIVPNCEIMFIAEAPGADEDAYGTEPLIGESGQLLNRCLEEAGINRSECSIVSVVQCKTPQNREPSKQEIQACFDIVENAIKIAKPKIIVPLGNVALKRIHKSSGITKKNGLVLEHKNYPGVKIVPIVHPSFVLRDPKNLMYLQQGLRRVKSLCGVAEVQYKKPVVTYIQNYQQFDAMIKDLSAKPYFTIDIETSHFKWTKGHIICIALSGAAGTSYILPWVIGDEKFYETCRTQALSTKKREIIDDIKKFCAFFSLNEPKFKWEGTDVKERFAALLADQNTIKILHNYCFDYKWLESAGLPIKGTIYDTMIMHYMLDESRGTHGLDDCALRFTPEYGEYWKGLDNYIIKSTKENRSDSYAIIPIEELIPYAATDADITFQIFQIFYQRMQEEDEGFLPLLNGFLMPLTALLMETERNGFRVDTDYLLKLETLLQDELAKIELKLRRYSPDINFKSTLQLSKLLFVQLGLPIIKKTDKGKPCTDESVLSSLANLHEVPKLLLEKRRLDKIYSTYVLGIKNNKWDDGKVHANFMCTGTETGRLSCNSPNMQNLPRNPPEGDLLHALGIKIRDLFINSDDEYVIVETDYSQAELRLIAEYSKDRNLYNAFLQGRDPHAELAVRLYHKERVPEMEAGLIVADKIVTKEERQKAKTANFALAYGKGAENFATENNIPIDEARYIHKVYWETYPGISEWKNAVLREAYQCDYFKSYFGRKRRMKKLKSTDKFIRGEAEREGINFVIQSQASDYTLYSTLKIVEEAKARNYRFRTVSFVHDSAVYEVHKQDLQNFLTLLREKMIHPPGVTITMECEIKVGVRLGSLKEWVNYKGLWGQKVKEKEEKKSTVLTDYLSKECNICKGKGFNKVINEVHSCLDINCCNVHLINFES